MSRAPTFQSEVLDQICRTCKRYLEKIILWPPNWVIWRVSVGERVAYAVHSVFLWCRWGGERCLSTVSHILQVAREHGMCPLELKAHRDLYLTQFWKIYRQVLGDAAWGNWIERSTLGVNYSSLMGEHRCFLGDQGGLIGRFQLGVILDSTWENLPEV